MHLLPSMNVVAVSHASCPKSNPATRYKHGMLVMYHQHLIGQIFERFVAGMQDHAISIKLSRANSGNYLCVNNII